MKHYEETKQKVIEILFSAEDESKKIDNMMIIIETAYSDGIEHQKEEIRNLAINISKSFGIPGLE